MPAHSATHRRLISKAASLVPITERGMNMRRRKRGQDEDIAAAETAHRGGIAVAYQECQKAMTIADEKWAEAYLVAKKQRDETIRLANTRREQTIAAAKSP